MKWKGGAVKEPRVLLRAIIGALLLANLAAAVIAFKPFGGSADDLRQQQQALSAQLRQLELQLAMSKRLGEKVQTARTQGDEFLSRYFLDERVMSATLLDELNRMSSTAGIRMGQVSAQKQPIEGSDTMYMLSIQAGFEGTYAGLAKFVNLVDKSSRFLIIENMQANVSQAPGGGAPAGQALNVTLKIDTFVKGDAGGIS
jgi:type IV pilus assembly protein PilO